MARAATPITALYLRTGSPSAMARAAILCPAGTWARTFTPNSGSTWPRASGALATSTLSSGCSRIRGLVTRSTLFQQFLELQALDQLRLALIDLRHVL